MDGVELESFDDAVDPIADLAMLRGTRGPRAALHPGGRAAAGHERGVVREDIELLVITAEVVPDNGPTIVPGEKESPRQRRAPNLRDLRRVALADSRNS